MPDSVITVCIVEDNRGTRRDLLTVLQHEPRLRCLAAYATAEAALTGVMDAMPDVALVDIHLPGMSGIDLVRQLKARLPRLQVLILTSYEESTLIFEALRAGASGYVLKQTIPEELISAIEDVHVGGSPMSFHIARKVVAYFHEAQQAHGDVQALSPRELEILSFLAQGYLIKEIGERLGIAFHTTRAHIRRIYEKLHVQSRSEAILKYLGR